MHGRVTHGCPQDLAELAAQDTVNVGMTDGIAGTLSVRDDSRPIPEVDLLGMTSGGTVMRGVRR